MPAGDPEETVVADHTGKLGVQGNDSVMCSLSLARI